MEQVVPLARGALDFLTSIRPHVDSSDLLRTGDTALINHHITDEPLKNVSTFVVAKNSRVAVVETDEITSCCGYSYQLWRPEPMEAQHMQCMSTEPQPYLMGATRDGTIHLAVVVDGDHFRLPKNVRWVNIRQEAQRLSDDECAEAIAATALEQWHRLAPFCVKCGSVTVSSSCGWTSTCTQCQNIEYPRQDPAIIVAIIDDEDRLILAHNVTWKEGYRSVVAGFMEVGESPEHAVAREVKEELGIVVTNIQYVASQPWPFPRSLMLGFTAKVAPSSPRGDAGEILILPDGKEIGSARFYSRQEYKDAIDSKELLPSGEVTFARYLIERWLGETIPHIKD